jgi:uncharacterized RDD family membrane protein YckC
MGWAGGWMDARERRHRIGLAFGEQHPFTVMFTGYLIFAFYILFADGLPGGQSLGKRLLRTAVIQERTGQPCGWWRSFVRNFMLALLGPLDWVFVFGKRRQRLGDMAAGTIVVALGARAPGATPMARASEPGPPDGRRARDKPPAPASPAQGHDWMPF